MAVTVPERRTWATMCRRSVNGRLLVTGMRGPRRAAQAGPGSPWGVPSAGAGHERVATSTGSSLSFDDATRTWWR